MNFSIARLYKSVLAFYPQVAAALMFLLILGLLRKFLHWQFIEWPPQNLWLSNLWIAGLVALIVYYILAFWQASKKIPGARNSNSSSQRVDCSLRYRWKSFLVLGVLFMCQFLFWYVGEFPGHLHQDETAVMYQTVQGKVVPILSTVYSIHAMTVHRFACSYPSLALPTIIIFSWIMADMFSLLIHFGIRLRYVLPWIALVVVSIPIGCSLIYLSHDIITACLKLGIIAVLLRLLVQAKIEGHQKIRLQTVCTLFMLTLAVAILRGENLILIFYLPALLLATRFLRWKQAAILSAVLLMGVMSYRLVVEPLAYGEGIKQIRQQYALTLIANPMRFMLLNSYASPTPEQDRETIFAVFPEEPITSPDTKTTNISFFWAHGVKEPVTDEKIAKLRQVLVKAALNNPAIFASNRVLVFTSCLGGSANTAYPVKFEREKFTDEELYGSFAEYIHNRWPFSRKEPGIIAQCTRTLRDWSSPQGVMTPGYWIWNITPAFLVTLITVLTWKYHPLSAMLSSILLVPLILVFLGTPAAHFKYLTDLYIFGFLIIPILIFEHTALKKVSAEAHLKTA